MSELTYAVAQKLLADTLAHCRAHNFNPMAVVVLGADGSVRAAGSEDNTTFMRWRVAYAKAYGAVNRIHFAGMQYRRDIASKALSLA